MNLARLLKCGLEPGGFWFMWRGDEVHYIAPLHRGRYPDGKWHSISFGVVYPSLDALAAEWRGYAIAVGEEEAWAWHLIPAPNAIECWIDRWLP